MILRKIITASLMAGLLIGTVASANNNEVDTDYTYLNTSKNTYMANKNGLIDARYAAKLITDWENKKPTGKGNLFVMQMGQINGVAGITGAFIKQSPDAGVYVYDRSAGCTTTGNSRTDGVSSVPKPVFTLTEMDEAFNAYGIDASKDVIMLVLGGASTSKDLSGYAAGAARMWYTLSYWGFPQDSIMLLNGQASNVLNPNINPHLADMGIEVTDIFSEGLSGYRFDADWKSVSTIERDGTKLQATMGDMMEVVEKASDNDTIFDARSLAEYDGTKASKTEYKTCVDGGTQCVTALNGHISGAESLPHTSILNTDDGAVDINSDGTLDVLDSSYTFKSLDAIKDIFAAKGYKEGNTVYTYCRTGTKASLVTFTSAAVLGYKTRMYDGSWIQWGKMASEVTDTDGIVHNNSKWSTEDYSVLIGNSDASKTSPINTLGLNLEADNTNAIIDADKAAK